MRQIKTKLSTINRWVVLLNITVKSIDIEFVAYCFHKGVISKVLE